MRYGSIISYGPLRAVLTCFLLSVAFFLLGFGAGKFQTFPYSLLQEIYWRTMPKIRTNKDLRQFQLYAPPRQLVFLGDSITAGGNWNDMFPHFSISNRGVGGETIQEIELRLADVIKQTPRVVVIMAGINDIRRYTDDADIHASYGRVIKKLVSSGSHVIVLATLHCSKEICSKSQNSQVDKLNAFLKERSSNFPDRVTFISWPVDSTSENTGAQSASPEDFLSDGIHPATEGYKVIETTLRPILYSLLKPSQ